MNSSVPSWEDVEASPSYAAKSPADRQELFGLWEQDKSAEYAQLKDLTPQELFRFRKGVAEKKAQLAGKPVTAEQMPALEMQVLNEIMPSDEDLADSDSFYVDEKFEGKVAAETDPVRRMILRGQRGLARDAIQARVGPPDQALAKKLQETGLFGSATLAANEAADKKISKREDGTWDLPLMRAAGDNELVNLLGGGAVLAGQKTGARLDDAGPGIDQAAIQKVFNDVQRESMLSDEEMAQAWDDFVIKNREMGDDEVLRTTSRGEIIPNGLNSAWLDPGKVKAALDKANVPEMEQKRFLDEEFQQIQYGTAARKAEAYDYATAYGMSDGSAVTGKFKSPAQWAKDKGLTFEPTPEMVSQYEAEVMDQSGWLDKKAFGLAAATVKGLLKAGGTVLGLAGMGLDKVAPESEDKKQADLSPLARFAGAVPEEGGTVANMGAESSRISAKIGSVAPDAGLIGKLVEEAPSLAIQFALTRGIGQLGGPVAASGGAYLAAGAQSAGLTYADALNQGKSVGEAREDALKSGVNTTIITGLFGTGALGGFESIAAKGATVGNLVDYARKRGIKALAKSPEMRQFVGTMLGAAAGEGLEEGIDELSQAFITADPDTSLASAWTNAVEAFKVGAFVGGAVEAGSNLAEGQRFESKTQAGLMAAGMTETARELAINNLELPQAEETEVSEPATGKVAKVGQADLPVTGEGGGDIARAIFGDPESKDREYPAELDAKSFGTTLEKDGRMRFTVDNVPTDRVFDPVTEKVEQVPLPEGQKAFNPAALTRTRPKAKAPANPSQEAGEEAKKTMTKAQKRRVELRDAFVSERQKTVAGALGRQQAQADLDSGPVKLSKVLEEVDRTVPVEFETSEDSVARFDPENDRVVVNAKASPASLRQRGLRNATVSALASRAGVDGAAIASEASPEILDAQGGSTPDQSGKLLVAAAINGDPKADAEVRRLMAEGSSPVKKQIGRLLGELAHASSGEGHVAEQVNLATKKYASTHGVELATAAPSRAMAPVAEGTRFTVTQDEFRAISKPVQGRGLAERRVDSGLAGESNTIRDNLPLGAVIEVKDARGNRVAHVVVATSERLNGHRSHYLAPVPSESQQVAGKIREIARRPQRLDEAYKMIRKAFSGNRAELADDLRSLVTSVLGDMVSPEFANDKLVFASQGAFMSWEEPGPLTPGHIQVNLAAMTASTGRYVDALKGDNEAALAGLAEDLLHVFEVQLYEELIHGVATESIAPDEVTAMVADWLALAKDNPSVAKALADAARWRAAGAPDSQAAQVNGMTDAEVVEWLDTQAEPVELWAVGHEAIASLAQVLKTGFSSGDAIAALNRWTESFIGNDPLSSLPTKGKEGMAAKLQSFIRRLVEMANRMIEAVNRFIGAHKAVRQLPGEINQALLRIDKLLSEQGIKAPDPYSIRDKAVAYYRNEISQAEDVLRSDRSPYDVQKDLRDALERVRREQGVNRSEMVTIDPMTGELSIQEGVEMSDSDRDTIQEALGFLNATGRPQLMLRTAASARDLQLVLGRNPGELVGKTRKDRARIIRETRNRELGRIRSLLPTPEFGGDPELDYVYRFNNALEQARQSRTSEVDNSNQAVDTLLLSSTGKALLERFQKANDYFAKRNREVQDLHRQIDAIRAQRRDLRERSMTRAAKTLREERVVQVDDSPVMVIETENSTPESDYEFQRRFWESAGRDLSLSREEAQLEQRQQDLIDKLKALNVETERDAAQKALNDFIEREIKDNTQLGQNLSRARDRQRRALADHAAFLRGDTMRPVRGIEDMMKRIGLDENFGFYGPDLGVSRAMGESQRVIDTVARLQTLPDELEFMVFGGRVPGRERSVNWQAVNTLRGPQALTGLPVQAGRAFRPGSTGVNPLDRLAMQRAFAEQLSRLNPVEATGGQVEIHYGLPNFVDPQTLENFDALVENPDFMARTYSEIVARSGVAIRDGADNAMRVLGYDPALPVDVPMREVKARMTNNALILGQGLTQKLHDRYFRNDASVSHIVLQTGGFPINRVVDVETDILGNPVKETVKWEFLPRMIELPSPPDFEQGSSTDKFVQMIGDGTVGRMLVSVGDFLHRMEQAGGEGGVLTHDEGLTPAGFAYQSLAAPYLRLLATLKNIPAWQGKSLQQWIAEGADNEVAGLGEQVDRLFAELLPMLERSHAFAEDRKKAQGGQDLDPIHQQFWQVYRMGGIVNALYQDTLEGLRGRNLIRTLSREAGVSEDLGGRELPWVPLMMDSMAFDNSISAEVRRNHQKPGDTEILSLLTPVRATDLLARFQRVMPDNSRMLVREDSGDEYVQAETDREGETRSSTRLADLQNWNRERMLQDEANMRRARAKVRTEAAMALFGGNMDAVIRYFHQPRFVALETTATGPEFSYNTERIDSDLMVELERLAAEERERGIVTESKSLATFDRDLRELAEQFPRAADAISAVLASGANIYRDIPSVAEASDSADPDEQVAFENDPFSMLTEVARTIPGIAFIQGRVPWEQKEEWSEEGVGRKVPGAVFTGSASKPVLILPYRDSRNLTAAEAQQAVAQMFSWLARNGNVPVIELATRLLRPLASLADPAQLERKQKLVDKLVGMKAPGDGVISQAEHAVIDRMAAAWAQGTRMEVMSELSAFAESPLAYGIVGERRLNVEAARELVTGQATPLSADEAASLLSAFLIHDPLKRVLAHSLLNEPPIDAKTPAGYDKLVGNFLRSEILPYGTESAVARFLANLPEGLATTSGEGERGVREIPEDGYAAVAQSLAERVEEMEGVEAAARVPFMALSPLMEGAAEAASALLLNTLSQLNFNGEVYPDGLLPQVPERQLTEMEARQVMGLFSQKELSELIEPGNPAQINDLELLASREGQQQNDSQDTRRWTTGDLMAASSRVANLLRGRYTGFRHTSSDYNARLLAARYGRPSADAYLEESMPRHRQYYQNRLYKGAISAVSRMMEFNPEEQEARFDANIDTLQQRLEAAGLPSTVQIGTLENGVMTSKTMPIVEHFREIYDAQVAAREAAVNGITTQAVALQEELRELTEALARVDSLKDELVSAPDAAAFLARFRNERDPVGLTSEPVAFEGIELDEEDLEFLDQSGRANRTLVSPSTEGRPLVAVTRLVEKFFGEQEDLIEALSEEMIRRADEFGVTMPWMNLRGLREINLNDRLGLKGFALSAFVNGGNEIGVPVTQLGRQIQAVFDELKELRQQALEDVPGSEGIEINESGEAVGLPNAVDANGNPVWYDMIDYPPARRRVERVEAQLRGLVKAYNEIAEEAAQRADDDFVEGVLSALEFRLPAPGREVGLLQRALAAGQAADKSARLADRVKALNDPNRVTGVMLSGIVKSALRGLQEVGDLPAAALASVRELESAAESPFEFPREAEAALEAVLRNETKASPEVRRAQLRNVLRQHVFTDLKRFEQARDLLKGALGAELEKVQGAIRTHRNAAAEVVGLAEQVAGLSELSTLEARDVVLEAAREAAKGSRHQAQGQLLALLTKRQQQRAKSRWMGETYTAVRNGRFIKVRLTGTPDQVAVTNLVLQEIGARWESLYQTNLNLPSTKTGMELVEQAQSQADVDLLRVEAAQKATGDSYRLIDRILVPDGAEARVAKIFENRHGRKPSAEELETAIGQISLATAAPLVGAAGHRTADFFGLGPDFDKVANQMADHMLNQIHKHYGQLYRGRDSFHETAKGIFTTGKLPLDVVREQHREMLLFLKRAELANRLSRIPPKSVSLAPEEVMKAPLLDRVVQLFRTLENAPDKDSMKDLLALYAEAQAELRAEVSSDVLKSGFINADMMHSGWVRHFLSETAKVRTLFAKSLKGQQAAMNVIGVLDYGTDANSGRNGFLGAEQAVARALHDAQMKLPKKQRFEMASGGYMVAAAVSYLQAGRAGEGQWERAKQMLDMLTIAESNILRALNSNISVSTGLSSGTVSRLLAGPKGALSRLKAWLTEDTWQMLNEKQVFDEVAGKLRPILEAVAGGTLGRDQAMVDLWRTIPKPARDYGKYLTEVFGYMADTLRAASMVEYDSRRLIRKPAVPFRWQTFGTHDRSLSEEYSDIQESLKMGRAAWHKNPKDAGYKPDQIEMLDINGLRAPLRVISDMLYRINVAPNYAVVRSMLGHVKEVDGTLQHMPGEEGAMVTKALESGETDNSTRDVAASLSIVARQLIEKDIRGGSPKTRLGAIGNTVGMTGMLSSLLSASQVWKQTIPAALTYAFVRGKNAAFLGDYARHVGDALAARTPWIEPSGLAQKIDAFVRDHAPFLYVRGADGVSMQLELAEQTRPSAANSTDTRFGKLPELAVQAGRYGLAMPVEKSLDWGKAALDGVMAKPEKILVRSIFMNEVVKAVNQRILAQRRVSREEVSLAEFLDDKGGVQSLVDEGLLTQARLVAVDMMAESDTSKKATIFQTPDSPGGDLARGLFVTFANHLLSTSANSYAAYKMWRQGDDEAQAEAKRIFASNLVQNIGYQLLNWKIVSGLLVAAAVAMGGGDEKDEERMLRNLYGLGEDDEQTPFGAVMRMMTLVVGGSNRPWGYSMTADRFSGQKSGDDWQSLASQLMVDSAAQTPGVGLLLSTTLGNSIVKGLANEAVGGPKYERAGIVLGEGPNGNWFERSVYNLSALYKNSMADRSYGLIGFDHLLEPAFQFSNTPQGELDEPTAGMALLSQLPFVPRELRAEAWRIFNKKSGTKLWGSQWKKRK